MDYLARVLEALKAQTLSTDNWELLVGDNASDEALAGWFDISWHPKARHIQERQLGLTAARLCGIRESLGDLCVFVDDDNVLAKNYLKTALDLAHEYPKIGAFGGNIAGEFELLPEQWARPYFGYLAIREVSKDLWSNDPNHWQAMPCGAGMVIRSNVAAKYADEARNDPLKLALGRIGNTLSSCDDSDLVMTAVSLDYGFGVFSSLKLDHLIPATRLTEEYLLRLVRSLHVSGGTLHFIRTGQLTPLQRSFRSIARHLYSRLTMDRRSWKFYRAAREGEREGHLLAKRLRQIRNSEREGV